MNLEHKLEAYTKKVGCAFILGNPLPCLEVMYGICEAYYQPTLVNGLTKNRY